MSAVETTLEAGKFFGQPVRRRHAYGLVVTENRFSADQVIPDHQHVMAHFTCVLAGRFTETYGETEFECQPRSVLVVPAGMNHCDRMGEEGAHTLSIEFSAKMERRIADSTRVLESPNVVSDAAVTRLIDRLYLEFRSSDPASLLLLASLSLELLAHMERSTALAGEPEWMSRAMAKLSADPSDCTSATLAKEAGVSEAQLSRAFRRIHGCSVADYLRWLRLEEAKTKLIETDAMISEIAIEAGFYDQAHFCRVFKGAFGTTPSKYRKMLSRLNSVQE